MEFVITLLSQQPLMTLFLTVALGYLLGEVNIKGFSLGAGAVLFVGLFIGWLAPNSAPGAAGGHPRAGPVPLLCRHPLRQALLYRPCHALPGRRPTCCPFLRLMVAGALSLACMDLFGLKLGYALGIFAGSGDQHSRPAGRHFRGRQQ